MRWLEDISLGNYYPSTSGVHALDPRLKIAAMALLMAATFACASPAAVGVHSAGLLGMAALSRIPLRVFLRSLRLFLWLFVATAVLHLFLTPGTPLTSQPLPGGLEITREGLRSGALVSWRLLAVVALSALLTSTTTPLQLTRGLEGLLRPLSRLRFPVQDFSLMMMIAIRFIPVLADEAQRVWMAQRSRGADLRRGGPRRRAATLGAVVLPVFTGLFRRADELALALEARGYEAGRPRTSMHEASWTRREWAAAALVVLWTGALVAVRIHP